MTATMAKLSNPFAADAVATYGKTQVTCASLGYMIEVHDELSGYLKAHPLDSRYGGAVGLRGPHGSGKTHILGWIADTARGWKSIRCTVVYGKCDSAHYFDLYHQFLRQLDRPYLIELVQLALLARAKEKVRSARVTESLVDRLETAGSLQVLESERNLDLEQLRTELQEVVAASIGGDTEIARILLDLPSSNLGADAYAWISGSDSADLRHLGVGQPLRALARAGRVDADLSALLALRAIAALHRIAGVPLIVLVDQFEVLLRIPDALAFESVSSLLKTFTEFLAEEKALTFIAGTSEAWQKLPRDTSARFRTREELAIGSLTPAETKILLAAYLPSTPTLPDGTVATLHELSGGSPREILRIAHHAFAATDGNIGKATRQVLLKAARKSGSVADRARIALMTAEAVAREARDMEFHAEDVDAAGVDALFESPGGDVLGALVLLKATDAVQEINMLQSPLDRVRERRDEQWPGARLLVVSVGYASDEARGLVGPSATSIVFNEKTFESELRSWLATLRKAPAAPAPVAQDVEVQYTRALEEISRRLAELEQTRTAQAEKVQARFNLESERLAAPLIEERKLATRREMLDALDSLGEALTMREPTDEQRIVRSLLVANEAYVRNSLLDELGELYLEALRLERLSPAAGIGSRHERAELVYAMRSSLRRRSGLDAALSHPMRVAVVGVSLVLGFIASGIYSSSLYAGIKTSYSFLPPPTDFISVLPYAFLALLALVGSAWWMHNVKNNLQRSRYRGQIEALRARARFGPELEDRSLRNQYPQA